MKRIVFKNKVFSLLDDIKKYNGNLGFNRYKKFDKDKEVSKKSNKPIKDKIYRDINNVPVHRGKMNFDLDL